MADLEAHAARIMELVAEFEALEDRPTRDRIFQLLEDIDHLHRSCVWRLFEVVTELGGKGLMDRLVHDPHVRTLFVLYDLISPDPLSPVEASVTMPPPASQGGFIPLASVRGRRPDWKMAFARADLRPDSLAGVEVAGTHVLICTVGEEIFAYRNGCGRGVLPLHLGVLSDGEIRCPWHGCRFDARTGRRLEKTGPDLQPFRVDVRDDRVYVATNSAPGPAAVRTVETSGER